MSNDELLKEAERLVGNVQGDWPVEKVSAVALESIAISLLVIARNSEPKS